MDHMTKANFQHMNMTISIHKKKITHDLGFYNTLTQKKDVRRKIPYDVKKKINK